MSVRFPFVIVQASKKDEDVDAELYVSESVLIQLVIEQLW